MVSEGLSVARSPAANGQHFERGYSPTRLEIDLDFPTTTSTSTHDLMSDQRVSAFSATPGSNGSASPDEAQPPLIVPAPLGPRNTIFFLDHRRRLAVTHYQTEDRSTPPTAVAAPQFVLRLYIRSSRSAFNTRDALMTILCWCEHLLVLPAVTHLLHELGLSGTSIRVEMYDGLDSFKTIIAHSRDEKEHRNMYIEYRDCVAELQEADQNIRHGKLALHPSVNPRIKRRLDRGNKLQTSIIDFEVSKRQPNAPAPPASVIIPPPAVAPASRPQGSNPVPQPPPPGHAILARQQAADLITQPSSTAAGAVSQAVPAAATSSSSSAYQMTLSLPPHNSTGQPRAATNTNDPGIPSGRGVLLASLARRPLDTTLPGPLRLSGILDQGRPPSTPDPSPPTAAPPASIATRVAKPGSPLNPLARSVAPIAPASFLGPQQPYHHAVLVIDEPGWHSRGIVVLKFDKEKDWTDVADAVGSLDEGDYVAERVSCHKHGRVEQRTAERNTPDGMKPVRLGEPGPEEDVEIVSKRWLGEVLVEIVRGGYFAHLAR